jgi:hypothetical protein
MLLDSLQPLHGARVLVPLSRFAIAYWHDQASRYTLTLDDIDQRDSAFCLLFIIVGV